jgi:hypothetical protein
MMLTVSESDDDLDKMPLEILSHIIFFCSQPTKLALGRCARYLRRLIWFSGHVLWKEITIYDTTNFSYILIKYRAIFSKIEKIVFGPECHSLRPTMLSVLYRMMPSLLSIYIDQVRDKFFLFGFHVNSNPISRNPYYWINSLNVDDESVNNLKDIRKLLQRLKEIRINIHNYSLGLYMLIDKFKDQCPYLSIQTVVPSPIPNRMHISWPMFQHSIMPFMVQLQQQ